MRTDFVESRDQVTDYILYFSAPWCGPCKHLRPIMEKLSDKYSDLDIFYVDIDEAQNSDLAVEFGIRSVPTVIYFEQGDLVKTVIGLQSESTYESLIQEYYYEV